MLACSIASQRCCESVGARTHICESIIDSLFVIVVDAPAQIPQEGTELSIKLLSATDNQQYISVHMESSKQTL